MNLTENYDFPDLPEETAKCIKCGNDFTFIPIRFFREEAYRSDTCDECQEARRAKIREEQEAQEKAKTLGDRLDLWSRTCPPRFLKSDTSHPEFKSRLHKSVMDWNPTDEKPWLGLIGKKGCCKTRIALLRLEQVVMTKEGPFSRGSTQPIFTTAYEFAETVQSKFGSTHDEAARKLEEYNSCRWLVFDDIGKARNTPAVVAALFALIDHRHAYNRQTIWTANSTPEEFCEGMPPDVAGPMVRRLKESSTLFSIA